MVRKVLKVPPNMVFSKDTVRAARDAGFVFSRRTFFNMPDDYVVINHGDTRPVEFGPRVRDAQVWNRPEHVAASIDKSQMIQRVHATIPEAHQVKTAESFAALGLDEAFFKPARGSRARGARIVRGDVGPGIYQEVLDIESEFRFVFAANNLVNVSKKEPLAEPGRFDWRSLGQATNLHAHSHNFARNIMEASVLQSVAVDLIRVVKPNGDKHYYFGEYNTAYGLGDFTAGRLFEAVELL